jgi:hypothetical protein
MSDCDLETGNHAGSGHHDGVDGGNASTTDGIAGSAAAADANQQALRAINALNAISSSSNSEDPADSAGGNGRGSGIVVSHRDVQAPSTPVPAAPTGLWSLWLRSAWLSPSWPTRTGYGSILPYLCVLLFALCAVMGLCVTRIHFYYFSVVAANVSYLGQLAAVIVLHTLYPALQPKDTHRSLAILTLAVIGVTVCVMTITGVCILSGRQIPLVMAGVAFIISFLYYYTYGRNNQKFSAIEIKLLLQLETPTAESERGKTLLALVC